jgi:agmatinase
MLKPTLQTFLDKPSSQEAKDYVIFSAPLDQTPSNRSGTRFGPDAIRRESSYLETLSLRTGLDWDDIKLADIGEVECPSVEEALSNISKTIETIKGIPVILGGEHTITLGALRTLKPDLVVVFDAHLDLRDKLFGENICHATYLRRGYEELGFKAVIIGVRALSKEEVEFTDDHKNIQWITAQEIIKEKTNPIKTIKKFMKDIDSFYLSIDMDVLDPAYAPGVGNPHPEGLSVVQIMDTIETTMNNKLVGMDLNEVYPSYDKGETATTAAYILMETIYAHINSLNKVSNNSH